MRSNNYLLKKFLKKGVAVITAMASITTMPLINARSIDSSCFEKFQETQIQVVCIWGDANYNDVIGSDDASQVLHTYSKNATGVSSSFNGREDVNFDGRVDSSDASLILEQYARVSTGRMEKFLDEGGVFIELPYGRTFSGIAVEEGISTAELQKLNPDFENINNLDAGQKIYVRRRPAFFEKEEETTTTKVTSTTVKPITTTKKVTSTTAKHTTTTKPTTTTKKVTTTTINPTTMITAPTTEVTVKPVNTIQTKPISGFENGKMYMLAPGYSSWRLFSDKGLKNEVTSLEKSQLIQVYYTDVEQTYKGVLKDETVVFFTVYPENFYKWVVVETTTSSTTAIPITTVIKKIYTNPDIDWNIRGSADTSAEIIGKLPYNAVYEVLSTLNGWEKISYNGLIGFIYVADYPDNFQKYVATSSTTTKATTIKPVTTTKENTTTTKPITTVIKKIYTNPDIDWNIRGSADTSAEIIGKLPYNAVYEVLSTLNGWEKISYNGLIGFIYIADYPDNFQKYVATSSTTTKENTTITKPITSVIKTKVYVGDDTWNVRRDATTNSEIIATIPSGGKYTCSGIIADGWEKISYNGMDGFLGTAGYEHLFVDADKVPVATTPVVAPSEGAFPESVLSVIRTVQSQYPNAKISASAYDLSGRRGYTYNGYTPLYAGCSLKAAYATFVLKQCEARGIDISKYCLEYREGMKNTGAGDLQYSEYGTMFTVGYLIDKLIIISDNTAYNILLSEFPMWEYKQWLNTIGGQQNIAAPYQLYGSASSRERVNEWVHVWNYLQTGSTYANRLRYNLSVASPNFLGTNVLHKSGSCDQWDYTCASDAGVVNGKYILAIVVQDAESENGSANAVRSIANAIRSWVASNNIF